VTINRSAPVMTVFGKHDHRIRSIARGLRGLTARQSIAVVASGLLAVAIGVSAAIGRQALASALIGLTAALGLLATIQLSRRFGQATRHRSAQIRDLARRLDLAVRRAQPPDNEQRQPANLHSALEAGQRRVLASLEIERLAAAERQRELQDSHRELLTRLSEVQDSVSNLINTSALKSVEKIAAEQRRLGRDMAKLQRDQTAETEALLQLYKEFRPRAPMPSSGRWAMDPTGLLEMLFLIRENEPKIVLELGSGTSSIWIAYELERYGGRLISVDHETDFADRTTSLLDLHEVSHVAEVRLAGLRPLNIEGEEFQWYDVDTFEDLSEIDLLLVDGPPGSPCETARYPALDVLQPRLAPSAVVILDDADRAGEQAIVQRWIADIPGLRRDREIFRRQAVLTYCRP
jgi:predicted O-methyltransferase YrrM